MSYKKWHVYESRNLWRFTVDNPEFYGVNVYSFFLIVPSILIKSWIMFFMGVFIVVASFILQHLLGISLSKGITRIKVMILSYIFGKYYV